MNIMRKLGFILISFSLATLLSLMLLDSKSDYRGGVLPFNIPLYKSKRTLVASYITYLQNRETEVLVDLKENSGVYLTVMNWDQIHDILYSNATSYFAYFNFTNSLDKKFGRIDRGLYLFMFYSNDKNQEVRMQIVQSGLEYDLVFFSLVLMSFGFFLILSSFLFNRMWLKVIKDE